MKLKKIICALMAMLIAVVCFSSCKNKKQPNNEVVDLNVPYNVSAEVKVGITADPIETALVEAVAEEFNQLYPNVTVTPVIIQGDYLTGLGTRFQADKKKPGTMPDVLFCDSTLSYTLIYNQLFENLDSYIDYEEKTNPEYLGQFYDYFMKLGQKDLNGSQYVLPRSADRVVTHLNTRVLNEAGVDMSIVKNGWTWDDFLSVCAKVREHFDNTGRKSQYIVDSYINWEAVMYPIFRSFNASVFDGNQNVTLDSTETQQALNLMKELVDKRYIAPLNSMGSANYEGGQGAMMFHSAPVYKYESILGDDYNLVTFPFIGNNPKVGAGLAGYAMYSGSRNKAVAWKFLSFLMSSDGQNALANGGSTCLPIRKDMADHKTNAWGSKYTDLNMDAYTYKIEYNQATDFYLGFDPSLQSDLIGLLSDFVHNYLSGMTYNMAISQFKIDVGSL